MMKEVLRHMKEKWR